MFFFGLALLTVEDRVSLEVPAGRLPEVVARLQGRERLLRVSPAFADEVVTLDVRNRPREEVLDQVARVMRATWVETPSGLRLERTAEMARLVAEEERKVFAGQLAPVVSQMEKYLAKWKTPGQRARAWVESYTRLADRERAGQVQSVQGVYDPRTEAPVEFLARQLVVDLGIERLSTLGTDYVVYARFPTAAQRSLPRTSEQAIEAYGQHEEALLATVDEAWAQTNKGRIVSMDAYKAASLKGGVGQALLILRRIGNRLYYGCGVYNREGRLRTYTGAPFQPTLPLPAKEDDLGTFELPAAGRTYLATYPQVSRNLPFQWIAEKAEGAPVLPALLDPETTDPLAIASGPVAIALARREGRSLVARLPDLIEPVTRAAAKDGTVDLSQFVAGAREQVRFVREDGWLRIEPKSATFCEYGRISRSALGRFLREAQKVGGITFRNASRMLASAPNRQTWSNPFVGSYGVGLVRTGVRGMGGQYVSSDLMMILGRLADRQWRAVLEGVPLDLSAPMHRELATRFLGGSLRWMSGPEGVPDFPDVLRTGTQAFPMGTVPGTTLTVRARSVGAVTLVEPGRAPAEWFLSQRMPSSAYEAMRQGGWPLLSEKTVPSMEALFSGTYRYGRRDAFEIRVTTPVGTWVEEIYDGDPVVSDGRGARRFAELPESFRRECDEAYARFVREMSGE